MKACARRFDILGNRLSFEVDSSSTYRSWIGGFFSILIILASLILALMFGNEVYERKTPNVFSLEERIDESRLYLKEMPFLFSFIWQNGTAIMDPLAYFTFRVKRFYFSEKMDITYDENISFAKCDPVKYSMHSDFVEKYISNPSVYYMCLDHNADSYIYNALSSANSAFYKIEFYRCDSSAQVCPEGIDLLMKEVYFFLTFINTYVDSSNNINPIQYYEYTHAQQTSDAFLKRLYISFTNNVYMSDNGFILTDSNSYNYVTLSAKSLDINPNDGIDTLNQMFNVTIDSPNIRQVTKRNYMKVQDLIAKVGGLVKGLIICVQVFLIHYSRVEYIHFVASTCQQYTNNSINETNSQLAISSESKTGKNEYILNQYDKGNMIRIDYAKLDKESVTPKVAQKRSATPISQNFIKKTTEKLSNHQASAHIDIPEFNYLMYLKNAICFASKKSQLYLQILSIFKEKVSFENYLKEHHLHTKN